MTSLQIHFNQLLSHVFPPLCLLALLAGTLTTSKAADFEPNELKLQASSVFGEEILTGPNHKVDEIMITHGYMNNFTIQSDFGEFKVSSNEQLIYRLAEVRALATLETASKTEAFGIALADAAKRPIETVTSIAKDPVGTAKGIPDGVGRLFSRTKRIVSDTYDDVNEYVAEQNNKSDDPESKSGEDEDSVVEKSVDFGEEYTKDQLGYNRSIRKLSKELQVDPYTDNVVLQEAMGDMAWVMAAGSLAMGSVIPSLPKAIGQLSDINDLVWDTNPLDLRIRNEKALREMDTREEVIEALYDNRNFTTTTRTRFIASLETIKGARGLPILVEHAAFAQNKAEARFFGRTGEILAAYNQSRQKITQILDTSVLPIGVTDNKTVVYILPVDYLSWTQKVSRSMELVDSQLDHRAPNYSIELWLEGKVTDPARQNITQLSWSVHDHSVKRLSSL